MPYPRSWRGAGLSEVAQAVRLPGRSVHLAVRRCRQRPSLDRMALDFRPSSFHHVTRVSPSSGFSVFTPRSALSAGACPLALSGSGKPLTQGSPLHPSPLQWGCCMNCCGAPDAIGSRLQRVVRRRIETERNSSPVDLVIKKPLKVVREDEVRKRHIDTDIERSDVVPPPDGYQQHITWTKLYVNDGRVCKERVPL